MHELMNTYQLDGQVRWLGMHLEKGFSGELYRFVADQRERVLRDRRQTPAARRTHTGTAGPHRIHHYGETGFNVVS